MKALRWIYGFILLCCLTGAAGAQNDHFADAADLTPLALPLFMYKPTVGTAEVGEPAHVSMAGEREPAVCVW